MAPLTQAHPCASDADAVDDAVDDPAIHVGEHEPQPAAAQR